MDQVWAFVEMCRQWLMQLPWGTVWHAFAVMTLPEWAGFLASLAGIIAFVIGIPRLRSVQHMQRYKALVELYKLNEQLMTRLRASDSATAQTYREALRDSIHANRFEFTPRDQAYLYTQWQKANSQAKKLISDMEEKQTRFGNLSDIAELIELRERLHGEIKRVRKAPMSMNE